MQKNQVTKLLALVLCLVLALSACAPKGGGDLPEGESDGARRTIPYGKMKYERPDTEAVKTQMEALVQRLADATDFETVMRLDEEATLLMEEFNTQYVLVFLAEYHDTTDEFYKEEMRFLEEEMVEVDQIINRFNTQLVEGEYAKQYREEVGDYLFESIEMSTLFTDESVKEYQKERNQLNMDYHDMIDGQTVDGPDGTPYTINEIMAVDEMELYFQLYEDYHDAYLEEYVRLYSRMAELDKITAAELGFDDAATMYYLKYNRDYTPADAEVLFSGIKEELLPVVPGGYFDGGKVSYKKAFSATAEALEEMSPEMKQAWDYMLKNELYDCKPLPNKRQGVAFTYYLASYDAPFLYSNYDDTFGQANTLVHEFGHFYSNYMHYDVVAPDNLDIAETYSQGLEVLMQHYYELYTDDVVEAQRENLSDLLSGALIWQSVLEEFQMRAFELDEIDTAKLGRLFAEVMDEYGYDSRYYADENGEANDWFMYATMFDSPFYTVSYVTSATSALQIWAQAQEDHAAAVETYQSLIHADQNQPYTQLLAAAGLKPFNDASVLEEIAALYTEAFAEEGESGGGAWWQAA